MKPVIQQEATGCAIASAAALAGVSYAQARKVANRIGIVASDEALWSQTGYMRKLLQQFGIRVAQRETAFTGWQQLPDRALLAIKWHLENDRAYWHWVVFVREPHGGACVLDSKPSLKHHRRTDFGRMHPKWYIEVLS